MKNFSKIVDLIIKEMLNPENMDITEKNIITSLIQSGYNMDEIDKAFAFIVKKIRESQDEEKSVQRIRILSDMEQAMLSANAQKVLLQYYYNNNITYEQLEETLNIINEMNKIVDTDNLNNIIHKILFKDKKEKYEHLRSLIN